MKQELYKKIYNASRVFAVLLCLFVGYYFWTGSGDYTKFAIYDEAVTSSNDTLVSSWIPLNGSTNVSLFYSVGDSTYMKGTFEYRYGSLTSVSSVAADTLSLDNRTGSSGLSKGKILQGCGLAASLIPGANAVRVTMIRQAASGGATNACYVGIVYGD